MVARIIGIVILDVAVAGLVFERILASSENMSSFDKIDG